MRVLHVEGKNLVEISPPYEFLNGDVYIIDNSDVSVGLKKKVFIWLGSQAFADSDPAVGAWAAKQLDFQDEEIDIDTVTEGNETDEFKNLINFVVVTGDTPGFLKHVEVNAKDISYALYRIRDVDLTDGSSSDDITIETVPLKRESFVSDDVFVLDSWNDLYVWIGASSQVGEKAAGNRLVRKLDVERARIPMIYTIHEDHEPKGFFELVDKIAKSKEIRDDAEEISIGITETTVDIKPPSELSPPPPSGAPEVKPSRVATQISQEEIPPPPKPEPSPSDFGLESISDKPKTETERKIVKLYYDHNLREFTEKAGNEDAILEINDANKTATLYFSDDSNLILQRTAARQARGICKSGFFIKEGYRVGINCVLNEVKGEKPIDERLLQDSHKYR